PLQAKLQGKIFVPQGEQAVDLTIDGQLLKTLQLEGKGQGLAALALQAKTQLAKQGVPSELLVTTNNLHWPLQGKADYQLSNVAISLAGDVNHYQLDGKGRVRGTNLPTTNLLVRGQGNLTSFSLSELLLALYEGTIKATGQLDWTNKIQWQASVNANHINTAAQLPNYPIVINGGLKTNGYWQDNDWVLNITGMDLKGRLKQQQINMQGNITG